MSIFVTVSLAIFFHFKISAFGLPDYMSSWYKLTLMHIWYPEIQSFSTHFRMVLMRLHISLDADAYLRLKRGLLSTMWMDVDKRLQIVGVRLYCIFFLYKIFRKNWIKFYRPKMMLDTCTDCTYKLFWNTTRWFSQFLFNFFRVFWTVIVPWLQPSGDVFTWKESATQSTF